MIIKIQNNHTARWNGGHYINFHDETGYNYDCISFMWEKNNPTQLDALGVFLTYANLEMSDPSARIIP